MKATIDQRFLEKVDRVFDASPTTVFNELLQNSRRAGATVVEVRLREEDGASGVRVEYSDNGAGVATPELLLRLAGSGWGNVTEEDEDPAGMGFFCLSNFEAVHCRSHNWSAVFTPGVFKGVQDLGENMDEFEYVAGMRTTWLWAAESVTIVDLYSAARSSAEYCGVGVVRVHATGLLTLVLPAKQFLGKCACVTEYPELGVAIGALPVGDPGAIPYGACSGAVSVELNFHGVRLFLADLGPHLGHLSQGRATIRVDVKKARGLQLVLPARNALKHNAAMSELLLLAERAVYQYMHDHGVQHRMPFTTYKRAKVEFGIDIAEALPTSLSLSLGHDWCSDTIARVKVPYGCSGELLGFESLFYSATGAHPCRPQTIYEGYGWYDKLRTLTGLRVAIDGRWVDDVSQFLTTAVEDAISWVESITVEFTLSDGDVIAHNTHCLVAGETTSCCFGDVIQSQTAYLTHDVKTSQEVRVEALEAWFDAAFEADVDYGDDGDNAQEQADRFEAELEAYFMEAVGDARGAAAITLNHALGNSALYNLLPNGWSWSIHEDGVAKSHLIVVGPYQDAEVAELRKIVFVHYADGRSCSVELTSNTPVTDERVHAYLAGHKGFSVDAGDCWELFPATPPVLLDSVERGSA